MGPTEQGGRGPFGGSGFTCPIFMKGIDMAGDLHVHTVIMTVHTKTGSVTTTTKVSCNCDEGKDHTTTTVIGTPPSD